jgi:peroxiredoxin
MFPRIRTAAAIALLAVLLPAGRIAASAPPPEYPKAPEFACTTLAGREIPFGALAEGRPFVVLVFFGVNCKPCQKELAQIGDLLRNGAFREQASVYAVNADGFPAGKLAAEMAKRKISVDFPVVADDNQVITNLYVDGVVPLTVVIDREGNLRLTVVGARPEGVRKIERLILAGKEAGAP